MSKVNILGSMYLEDEFEQYIQFRVVVNNLNSWVPHLKGLKFYGCQATVL